MTSKLHIPVPAVVLFVEDVALLTRFFQHIGSMKISHQDDDHAVLEIGGLELVIHAIPKSVLPSRDSSVPVSVREDANWKLCLPVEGIATARARASELGGFIKPLANEWSARGFTACDGHDPEGNVIQVRANAAD
jgi:hypothetical protein